MHRGLTGTFLSSLQQNDLFVKLNWSVSTFLKLQEVDLTFYGVYSGVTVVEILLERSSGKKKQKRKNCQAVNVPNRAKCITKRRASFPSYFLYFFFFCRFPFYSLDPLITEDSPYYVSLEGLYLLSRKSSLNRPLILLLYATAILWVPSFRFD